MEQGNENNVSQDAYNVWLTKAVLNKEGIGAQLYMQTQELIAVRERLFASLSVELSQISREDMIIYGERSKNDQITILRLPCMFAHRLSSQEKGKIVIQRKPMRISYLGERVYQTLLNFDRDLAIKAAIRFKQVFQSGNLFVNDMKQSLWAGLDASYLQKFHTSAELHLAALAEPITAKNFTVSIVASPRHDIIAASFINQHGNNVAFQFEDFQ